MLRWLSLSANRVGEAGCVALLRACSTHATALQELDLGRPPHSIDFQRHIGRDIPADTLDKGWAACINYLCFFDEVWGRYPGLLSPSQVGVC
jgi:hypothetical protein